MPYGGYSGKKEDLLQITVKTKVAFYVLRENLECICVRISYALRLTDAPPAYAITHIVKPRESLLTSHIDMGNQL